MPNNRCGDGSGRSMVDHGVHHRRGTAAWLAASQASIDREMARLARHDALALVMGKELIMPTDIGTQIKLIDDTARQLAAARIDLAETTLAGAIALCDGVQRLNMLVTPEIMAKVMVLCDHPSGFSTDRRKGSGSKYPAYTADEVKPCFVQSLLEGLPLIGNHWNILFASCYTTGKGWLYKIANIPGITDVIVSPGAPGNLKESNNKVVRVAISWRHEGSLRRLVNERGEPWALIEVCPKNNSGPEMWVGVAKAKALHRAYCQITGSRSVADLDDLGELPPPAEITGPAQQQEGGVSDAINPSQTQPAPVLPIEAEEDINLRWSRWTDGVAGCSTEAELDVFHRQLVEEDELHENEHDRLERFLRVRRKQLRGKPA